MHNISGTHLMPGSDTANRNRPVQSSRLEDLLNDLISINEPASSPNQTHTQTQGSISAQHGRQYFAAQTASGDSSSYSAVNSQNRGVAKAINCDSGQRLLPQELRAHLKFGPGSEAAFQALKTFYQANRHKPLLELPSGKIFYIDYEVETERVRVYQGSKSEFMLIAGGLREQLGMLVIDEVFEYKLETQISEFLGFKKKELKVKDRHRLGSELLRANDLVAGRKVYPVLHFAIFSEKAGGISQSSVKAESIK